MLCEPGNWLPFWIVGFIVSDNQLDDVAEWIRFNDVMVFEPVYCVIDTVLDVLLESVWIFYVNLVYL